MAATSEIWPTAGGVLGGIFGGGKDYWHDLLFHPDNAEMGFPVLPGGTAWTEELRVLGAIVGHLRPEVAVEFGCFRGASLRAARSIWRPPTHVAFDVDPGCAETIPDGVQFVLADWRLTEAWLKKVSPVDFAFVDCEHTAAAVEGMLRMIARNAAARATVVVHDCDPPMCEGVRDVDGVMAFARNVENWRLSFLDTPNRLAILRRLV